MRSIATHRAPDADALAAAWLVKRFLFRDEDSEVVFVARDFAPPSVPRFDAVVDVGRVSDPSRLLFDHKPPAFADRDSTCATRLVWEHLSLGRPVAHLANLVQAVHDGDAATRRAGSAAYRASRESGFHAFVADARKSKLSDAGLFDAAARWLDGPEQAQRAGTEPPEGWERTATGLPDVPGTYALVLRAPRAASVAVGRSARLPALALEEGRYSYVGSARGGGGLRGRLRRHLGPARTLPARWDIDFVRLACAVEEVRYAITGADLECAWAEALASSSGASRMPGRIGAADRRCAGHLVRLGPGLLDSILLDAAGHPARRLVLGKADADR